MTGYKRFQDTLFIVCIIIYQYTEDAITRRDGATLRVVIVVEATVFIIDFLAESVGIDRRFPVFGLEQTVVTKIRQRLFSGFRHTNDP